MIDNLLGGDDDDDSDESGADDMDGGLFNGDEGDDLMGGGDDMMGGDDMTGGDDMMGGDDMGFDDMDDMDGGGGTSAEMDNRIDELENEVASLSSTVNTVKSENEQINESVGEVEENVRKLLEVYEMVTRGVNPFVDENEMGDAFGGGSGTGDGGSMGLFGNDEDEQADVDDAVADADADEFFDDDLDGEDDFDDDFDDLDGGDDDFDEGFDDSDEGFDDSDEGFDDSDEGFDEFDDEGFDEFDDDGDDDLDSDDGDGGSDGKSFEELKAEYDSGEADWDDEDDGDDDADESDPVEDAVDAESTEELEEPTASEPIATTVTEDVDEGVADADPTGSAGAASTDTGSPVDGGKPYLGSVPSGYVADIVVMDWLEFLVEEAGVDGAARTIAYYEAIDWLDEAAEETLQTFLKGFGDGVESDPDPRSSLTVAHHNRSLRFISRIANPDVEMVAFDERAGDGAPGRGSGSNVGPVPRASGGRGVRSGRPDGRGIESDGGQNRTGGRDRVPEGSRDGSHSGSGSQSGGRPAEGGIDRTKSGFDWGDERTE
jgi:archaellum component FlaD/FlaE